MYMYVVHMCAISCNIYIVIDECVDGNIRLVNGSRVTEGRVEVCSGGVWGTIAGVTTRFDNTAAQVACRQLGYTDKCEYITCTYMHTFTCISVRN